MTDRAPEMVGAAALLVAAGACAVAACGGRGAADAERSAGFQRLAGGLGLGTATDLSACDAAFDARLAPVCEVGLEPLPGGFAFCLHHAGPGLRLR